MWTTTNDNLPIDRIIGVYSGRKIPMDAQIDLVSHVDYIDEIIDAGKRDPGRARDAANNPGSGFLRQWVRCGR